MEVEDPQAFIKAWAKRMTIRHGGSTVWDQILLQDVTWEQGLWRFTHDDVSTLSPGVHLWTPGDLDAAIEWEEARPVGDFDSGDWPRFLLTPAARQLGRCDPLDHDWTLTVDSGEVQVDCENPCPSELIVPKWTGGQDRRQNRVSLYSYAWSCCHKWGEELKDKVGGSFKVKIYVDTDPWQDEEHWPIYAAESLFDPGSHVCSMCGCQVRPPRMARRRSDSAIICPLCGEVDARNTLFDPKTLEPTRKFKSWLTDTPTEERQDGTADSDAGGAAAPVEA